MIRFLAENWIWIVAIGGMMLMHRGHGGHGGCGGHSSHAEHGHSEPGLPRGYDQPSTQTEAEDRGMRAVDAPPQHAHPGATTSDPAVPSRHRGC